MFINYYSCWETYIEIVITSNGNTGGLKYNGKKKAYAYRL
jgi:hypothetical protein